ncbi:MAG: cysteine desulfurase, partial [Candidatus Marinimicrobia bacterium]|nr:cysteine desulfurase [Candidatus Neomarinimicrobiota bacterium]
MKPIYLDYNATTPIDPRVAEAMQPYLTEYFGNPSSNHYFGRQARQTVEAARQQVAKMIRAAPDEIVFTSGGTESNNWAIKGVAESRRHLGNHIITSAVEHPAVLEVCDYLANHGFRVTRVPVDSDGMVSVDAVADAITPDTILITILHANNEVGTIQPIADISRLAHAHEIIMHTDAAQSVGKIPVNVSELGVDLLSIAGHKLYAPKGIGALYIRKGLRLDKLMHGANHELNRRAGTENVLEIVGLGEACKLVREN